MTKRKVNPLPRGSWTKTHGHAGNRTPSPTYNSWRGMIGRCKPHKQYGKAGITVCARWQNFATFLADMGERPEGCEIDRIDPLGHYQPSNCRWAPLRENRQQRRATVLTMAKREQVLLLRGEGKSHREIAKTMGVSKTCIGDFLRGASWGDIPRPPGWMVA